MTMRAQYLREDKMDLIDEILDNVKTIAVVGLSDNPARDSNGVSAYMQTQGYRIIPVNPALNGATVLGEQSYDDLTSASAAAQAQGIAIDLVDVFRRSEFAGAVTDDAISIGARYVWMQDGVVDQAAAQRAESAGLGVIMDDCIPPPAQAAAGRIDVSPVGDGSIASTGSNDDEIRQPVSGYEPVLGAPAHLAGLSQPPDCGSGRGVGAAVAGKLPS